jgi:hypothetical protein
MAKIKIKNAIISSSGDFGLSHGTTQIQNITSAGIQITGSLFASASSTVSDLFKIGNNYIYASSSGQVGIGTENPTALLEISGSADRDYLIIRSGSLQGMTINSQGVLVLGAFSGSNIPTAVSGGLYYNYGDNAFFLGEN